MDNTGITRIVAIILTVLGMVFTFQFLSIDSFASEEVTQSWIDERTVGDYLLADDAFVYEFQYFIKYHNGNPDIYSFVKISTNYPLIYNSISNSYESGSHVDWLRNMEIYDKFGNVGSGTSNPSTPYDVSNFVVIPNVIPMTDYEADIQFSVNSSWGDIAVDWADNTGDVTAVKVELAHGPLFPLVFESYINEAYNNPFVYDSSYEKYDVKHLYTIVVTAYDYNNNVLKTQTFNNIRMGGYDLTRVFEDEYKFNLTYVDEGLKVTALQNCDVNYMIELVSKDRKVKILGTRNFMNRTDSNIMSMLMGDSFLIPWTDLGAASNTLVDADFKISARTYQSADEMVLVYDGSINKKFIITSDVNPITGNEYSQYFDMDDINSIDPSTFTLSDGYQTFKDLQASTQQTIVFMGGLHGLFSGLIIVQIALGVALARLGIVIVISLIKLFL